ncbi:transglutaminase TgpA family protein [Undibacterium sp. Ren11W]|uniref:transglutaminase TgpA family protein n=1 Tax=Undibacterium sp. Ren11W TaxID=3413045 RepID=UPI003BF3A23C
MKPPANSWFSSWRQWRKSPALARDKANTLLLLLAGLLVVLPHSSALPWWTSAACLVLMGWRTLLTVTGRRLPSLWILTPISVLLMAAAYLTYHTLLGREAGICMLALLLTCKLLEMHAKRDIFVIIFLSFFLLLTSFFNSQSIASAGWATLATLALLTALLSFQYTGLMPSLWQRIKLAMRILGMAIPLTVIAFFLFPRIQGPLWGLPGDANTGRSGLSNSMTPGNISKLVQSEEIAFRVKFSGALPPKSDLYWRGIVLNQFDGRTWSHTDETQAQADQDAAKDHNAAILNGEAVSQDIILEPSGQAWLFALDIPAAAPSKAGLLVKLNHQRELSSVTEINSRLRYSVVSHTSYRLQAQLSASDLQSSLYLPPNYNPKTRNYAASLKQGVSNPQQAIVAVLNLFRNENFSYTLEPPLLGTNSVDDFLFGSRAGFCEHYSSAFVVLMRAMGIPARVVTGYQGGSLNQIDNQLEVRQSDAHAWAEVWLNGRGWVRLDPTAAVAPERIQKNLGATQAASGLAGLIQLSMNQNSWLGSSLNGLRMRWNAANNSWNLWVLNYDQGKQFDLVRALGLEGFDWTQLSLIAFLLIGLAMAAMALPFMLNRPQVTPIDRLYLDLCQKMARKGFPRLPHEAPRTYSLRLQKLVPAPQYGALQSFILAYSAAKYGKTMGSDSALLKQLKVLFARCR